MIGKSRLIDRSLSTIAQISSFEIAQSEVCEYMAMVHVSDCLLSFDEQLKSLLQTLCNLRKSILNSHIVFTRFFLSDAANQTDLLLDGIGSCEYGAVSFVEQPPLDGSKVAVWAYIQTNVRVKSLGNGLFETVHNGCAHYRTGTSLSPSADSETQMRLLFRNYIKMLLSRGCTLAGNCIRTWIFVQNIDVNYSGVVKARNEIFAEQGLSPETHFICSTGIQGRNADPRAIVQMSTYAVSGIRKDQIRHLHACSRMSPTSKYGVSFERGTSIHYSDRAHVFISGTASIDCDGRVVHEGDVGRQIERLCGNVEALLSEDGCCFADVVQMIVYVRDLSDFQIVRSAFDKGFPDIPTAFVLASVCRPSWLVEMECMAIRPNVDPESAAY